MGAVGIKIEIEFGLQRVKKQKTIVDAAMSYLTRFRYNETMIFVTIAVNNDHCL